MDYFCHNDQYIIKKSALEEGCCIIVEDIHQRDEEIPEFFHSYDILLFDYFDGVVVIVDSNRSTVLQVFQILDNDQCESLLLSPFTPKSTPSNDDLISDFEIITPPPQEKREEIEGEDFFEEHDNEKKKKNEMYLHICDVDMVGIMKEKFWNLGLTYDKIDEIQLFSENQAVVFYQECLFLIRFDSVESQQPNDDSSVQRNFEVLSHINNEYISSTWSPERNLTKIRMFTVSQSSKKIAIYTTNESVNQILFLSSVDMEVKSEKKIFSSEKYLIKDFEAGFMKISEDGSSLIVGDKDGCYFYLFNYRLWREDGLFYRGRKSCNVKNISFSPDGLFLSVLSNLPTVHIFSVSQAKQNAGKYFGGLLSNSIRSFVTYRIKESDDFDICVFDSQPNCLRLIGPKRSIVVKFDGRKGGVSSELKVKERKGKGLVRVVIDNIIFCEMYRKQVLDLDKSISSIKRSHKRRLNINIIEKETIWERNQVINGIIGEFDYFFFQIEVNNKVVRSTHPIIGKEMRNMLLQKSKLCFNFMLPLVYSDIEESKMVIELIRVRGSKMLLHFEYKLPRYVCKGFRFSLTLENTSPTESSKRREGRTIMGSLVIPAGTGLICTVGTIAVSPILSAGGAVAGGLAGTVMGFSAAVFFSPISVLFSPLTAVAGGVAGVVGGAVCAPSWLIYKGAIQGKKEFSRVENPILRDYKFFNFIASVTFEPINFGREMQYLEYMYPFYKIFSPTHPGLVVLIKIMFSFLGYSDLKRMMKVSTHFARAAIDVYNFNRLEFNGGYTSKFRELWE